MISCLNNYIGIQGVTGYDYPTSKTFVNGLPGITTDILEEISNEDDYTIQLAWADILNRAIARLESDINNWAPKNFLNYSHLDNNTTGQFDDLENIDTSNKYNGWYFDMSTYSKNLNIQFNSVDIYTRNSGQDYIYIFNASTGAQLEKLNFSFKDNQINTLYIAKEYPVWKYPNLFIAYDANNVQAIVSQDEFIGEWDYISKREVSTGTSPQKDNLSGADETGMVLNYNLLCSIDNFVCHRRELFKDSFWYLLGTEFCNERLFSDRINRYTLLNRDEAIQMRDQFDAEYKSKISGVLRGVKMRNNDECFVCNRAVNHRTMLP